VVTAPGSGAEVIPFLKTWVNLPMAIGFTVLYAKVTCLPESGSFHIYHVVMHAMEDAVMVCTLTVGLQFSCALMSK